MAKERYGWRYKATLGQYWLQRLTPCGEYSDSIEEWGCYKTSIKMYEAIAEAEAAEAAAKEKALEAERGWVYV